MPFGLCNAPATFQSYMGDLNLKDYLIYLDYSIIFHENIDSHIDHLDLWFERLAEYELTIKPLTCECLQKEMTYLGHLVSEEGIKADPKISEVLNNCPTQKTVKHVRKCLGFACCYMRLASIARPLNNFVIGIPTKKNIISWRRSSKLHLSVMGRNNFWQHQRAIDKSSYSCISNSFTLHIDASFVGREHFFTRCRTITT